MTPRPVATLAEFLLARIAEDEERARKRMHHAQENHLLLQDPKYLGRVIPGWYEWPEIEADAARVLAECDAKRRIVELHSGQFQCDTCLDSEETDEGPEGDAYSYAVMKSAPCPTLRLLALPYADHPDYDQAWRP